MNFRLTLPAADVFQILDALDSRAAAWESTARKLEGVSDPEEDMTVQEECSDAAEAKEIARHFRSIAGMIRTQIAAPQSHPKSTTQQ